MRHRFKPLHMCSYTTHSSPVLVIIHWRPSWRAQRVLNLNCHTNACLCCINAGKGRDRRSVPLGSSWWRGQCLPTPVLAASAMVAATAATMIAVVAVACVAGASCGIPQHSDGPSGAATRECRELPTTGVPHVCLPITALQQHPGWHAAMRRRGRPLCPPHLRSMGW